VLRANQVSGTCFCDSDRHEGGLILGVEGQSLVILMALAQCAVGLVAGVAVSWPQVICSAGVLPVTALCCRRLEREVILCGPGVLWHVVAPAVELSQLVDVLGELCVRIVPGFKDLVGSQQLVGGDLLLVATGT